MCFYALALPLLSLLLTTLLLLSLLVLNVALSVIYKSCTAASMYSCAVPFLAHAT
jgi:hypothetical protein